MADTENVLDQAADWLDAGKGVALATVIGTWGSSPRPVGSQLAVDDKGAFVGSVSGGCIEGAVVGEALSTINDGQVRILDFGVTDEQAWEVGLACGGNVRIFVERSEDQAELKRLAAEKPVATVTDLADGRRGFVTPSDISGELPLDEAIVAKARLALRDDRSNVHETGGVELFVHVHNPPLRLFVVGAVHIAQALVPMARIAGYNVTVADPRGSFATDDRFPGTTLSEEWPDDALNAFAPDTRTAIVTLTHDPKLDDPALEVALNSDAFYIGSLGSRRTHASRIERLTEAGYSEEQMARIQAPIGLDLGSASPAEIAVSILAEIIAAKHGKLDTE
ncbi:MAG: XdhC family protein [Rhodospirillales bacterium]|jgi:xanthine dehydrogenase accessory factor|nr:XdhC/CoxI family protein [Rhodospirillaceae bacterium]MDP6429648.1 XdhC family protein [Rhodospirillales bacterium]MDP6644141.1 XdhC family protein [Rhodospirillales bacterium]|tara:strand:+ start:704 stop:1711 length:1008 start_codon:yes stop_codon:yes gene_type:complete